ncbi:hypothetical protein A4H97_05115 [Niastella yeongjuensis]|uniref:MoxR-vWA-beta-propeller ternary system domain-containing protein n=1 Tax=Niastella yeongjuensis TaxID=354355 RepID=A0A1V9ELI0_9BACT|nr:hypothetical protein [Niastella yeongjuensis]OQP46902.1 hypothetical protein A4H97_05115 [Niastella yeongjuensis]SEN59668.1 hypothetical protein SAMN05660816_01046 [Niastella yeongjuensis]
MIELIIVLSITDKAALGAVRCLPGLKAAEKEAFIWVRGIPMDETIDLRIRQLPGLHTYTLDEDGNLFPPRGLTPVGKLQSMNWAPVSDYIKVTLPVSALPGKINRQMAVQLVPSQQLQKGNALLTDLTAWKAYGETAPLVRLQQTRFAVSEENKVLVMGDLLPALPGKEYVLLNDLLIPCGYEFDPPVISSLIASQFSPDNDSILLFDIDSTWEEIPKDAFVQSTRSAIRLTKGGNDG